MSPVTVVPEPDPWYAERVRLVTAIEEGVARCFSDSHTARRRVEEIADQVLMKLARGRPWPYLNQEEP